MSSGDQAVPAVGRSKTPRGTSAWFWQFLETELVPYPGRVWLVARITIAATIIMVLVMTLRIPYGFLGVIATFFLSRENPGVTLRSFIGIAIVSAFCILYSIVGIMMLVNDPLTHFLWIATSVFLAFYLIRVVSSYGLAIGFGGILGAIIPLWDETQLTVNARTENTLWVLGALTMGTAVTVVVEYLFHHVRPFDVLTEAIDSRLQAVENVLRQIAAGHPVSSKAKRDISQYSALGTSGLRQKLLRSDDPRLFVTQMNIAVALFGRLVDLAASLCVVCSAHSLEFPTAELTRCWRLADQVSNLRGDLRERRLPRVTEIPSQPEPSELPLLPEMERTVALIPHAFSGTASAEEFLVPPSLGEEVRSSLFAPDAFSNVEHFQFAVGGTAAAMLAYVVYQAIDWPGLSTAVVTCILTALSTIGSSRQKQFLRLGGATIGGFVFGMGAQIFVLPYLHSITGFAVLFAAVTAISSWIFVATPRLSYLGLQIAFAFYLIHLQEFAPQTSLSIARDRVVGVLLGLTCMWLIFDRIWAKNALQEMRDMFCNNLERLAKLFELSRKPDREAAAKRAMQLRDQITHGFAAVKAQSDAVLFEFGPSRERKLKIRADFKRWQPNIGILLQVEMTYLQYLAELWTSLPPAITEAQSAFEEDMAVLVRAMSDDVAGKVSTAAPDVQQSAETLRRDIRNYYEQSALTIPHRIADMITLSQNLASIASPLHTDIHNTFTNPGTASCTILKPA